MPECPQCSLINPPGAEVCDCGYRFSGRPTSIARTSAGPSAEVKTFSYAKYNKQFMLEGVWSPKAMDDHVAEMLREGWQLLNSSGDSGHVNVGRTVIAAAATGGLSLLLGASRSRERITLTFTRIRG